MSYCTVTPIETPSIISLEYNTLWKASSLHQKINSKSQGPHAQHLSSKLLTCYKVTEANSSQSDNHKVDGLQGCPSLDVFEDNCRNGHKDNAACQDEEDGRDHPDLCLTHLLFLEKGNNKRKKNFFSGFLGLYTLWMADWSCCCHLECLFLPFVSLLGGIQPSLPTSESPAWVIVNLYVWPQKIPIFHALDSY